MEQLMLHPFIIIQALIALSFFTFITKWLYKPSTNKSLPPSPRKLPVLGNLHQLGSLPHRSLQSLARKHGPLMLLHFGSRPTLIVSSADAAHEIMRTHDLNFANRPDTSVGRRLLYDYKDVSTAPYGEYWRQLKSICVLQLLSSKRVQSFRKIRVEETSLLVEKIRNSCSGSALVNLSEIFAGFANDVVCRSALGRKYSGDGDQSDGKRSYLVLLIEFNELLGSFSVGDFIPWLSWINRLNGFDAKIDKVARELDEFLEGVIKERTEILKNQDIASHENNEENFVDILLNIYHNNNTVGVNIDRDSIKGIILDVFSAGTDSTSTVLEWAMTELLRHPSTMKKLQEEVRSTTKDSHKHDIITEKDLEKMIYLKAVIKETLRLHTPIPLLVPRVASNDVNILGYDLKAGTMVITNAWAISRDPMYWDQPEKFVPERFLNSSKDYRGLDFELLPFGSGRRICPGITFAIVSNEYALANIVKRFEWRLPDGDRDLDMSEKPGVAVHRAVPLLAVASEYHG